MGVRQDVVEVVRSSVAGHAVAGKVGKSVLQPTIGDALRGQGFVVDREDAGQLLSAGMPVWRSKDDGQVVPTKGRRRVDLVVYEDGMPIALIETESDLDDLRTSGVTRRNGHYDVASIAKRADGRYFDSYNSVERMASAVFYWSLRNHMGQYPSPVQAQQRLEAIASDDPAIHNPSGLTLVLVSGRCRPQDAGILAARLKSLGAVLVCVNGG